jgi:ATP-dependent DNA helicase RecG
MTPAELPTSESLTVEFKSDRKRLGDDELIEAVVCLANTEGGAVYLGIEDDGAVTGLHASRPEPKGLAALIANRTAPAVIVDVETLDINGARVVRLNVPKATQVVSTSQGLTKRRRIGADGKPECAPLLPHQVATRLSDIGRLDATRLPLPGATLDHLDPAERARLRQLVERFQGDRALLSLSDEELDGALHLVVHEAGKRVPSLAGMLLLGRESALNELAPTHEIAFQVLEGEQVRMNEFSRAPLLRAFEWLETTFAPLNLEEEVQVGLFRVGVPRVDRFAYREAIANALTHRDYTRLGAVHVKLDQEALTISNPGGFVEGVTQANLLTTAPHARNPVLADAFKRVGIVERTGRGVDLIYRGLLRYGRRLPDYSGSNATSVTLRMSASNADLGFLRLVLDAESQRGGALPIDSLIALACLRDQRRLAADELAKLIQRDRTDAKRTLEALVEAGLVEARGNSRGRTYTLSARVYREVGEAVQYTRQAGFDRYQQEQMVLNHARAHGGVRRPDVTGLCQLTEAQATRLLDRMVKAGQLEAVGLRRWRVYRIPGHGAEGGSVV